MREWRNSKCDIHSSMIRLKNFMRHFSPFEWLIHISFMSYSIYRFTCTRTPWAVLLKSLVCVCVFINIFTSNNGVCTRNEWQKCHCFPSRNRNEKPNIGYTHLIESCAIATTVAVTRARQKEYGNMCVCVRVTNTKKWSWLTTFRFVCVCAFFFLLAIMCWFVWARARTPARIFHSKNNIFRIATKSRTLAHVENQRVLVATEMSNVLCDKISAIPISKINVHCSIWHITGDLYCGERHGRYTPIELYLWGVPFIVVMFVVAVIAAFAVVIIT